MRVKPHIHYKWPARVDLISTRNVSRALGLQSRRARRLYIRLLYKHLKGDNAASVLLQAAKHAHERGLWAKSATVGDIQFWILRGFYKIDKENYHASQQDWHSWLMATGWRWTSRGKNFSKTSGSVRKRA